MSSVAKQNNNFKHFSNKECEYYPCHDLENINCLFCYCPLYLTDCGGNFVMYNGIKDCSHCTLVHDEGSFDFVQKALKANLGFL